MVIWPLADYQSQLFIFFLKFQTFILFVDSSFSINSFDHFLTSPCENWTLISTLTYIGERCILGGKFSIGLTSAATAEGRLLKNLGIGRLFLTLVILCFPQRFPISKTTKKLFLTLAVTNNGAKVF